MRSPACAKTPALSCQYRQAPGEVPEGLCPRQRPGPCSARHRELFFATQIRNRNTREAYLRAVRDFLGWVEIEAGIEDLLDIEPLHVAAWVEIKTQTYEAQSIKEQLTALRHLFDWLVTGHVLHTNPASFVRGPKFSYTKGKTPILTPNEARKLIRSIPTDTLVGLRDRALIGLGSTPSPGSRPR